MRHGASRVVSRSIAWHVIVALLLSSCASRRVKPIGAEKPFKPDADGMLTIPDTPGLGITLNPDALRKFGRTS